MREKKMKRRKEIDLKEKNIYKIRNKKENKWPNAVEHKIKKLFKYLQTLYHVPSNRVVVFPAAMEADRSRPTVGSLVHTTLCAPMLPSV